MLSLEALDRIRHPFDSAADMGPDLGTEPDVLGEAWRQAATAESVLRRIARHRIGHDDVAAAFGADELRRLRPLLLAAGQASGRVTRAARLASCPADVDG